MVALFPPHPDVEASGRGLRVSRYFDPADGPPHTRMSIYGADGRVTCVVAIDDDSTDGGLTRFLESLSAGSGLPHRRRTGVLDRLAGGAYDEFRLTRASQFLTRQRGGRPHGRAHHRHP